MKHLLFLFKSRFLYSSPWLLTAAAGLLIIIVVTFAFHNLRLEKRLMTNAMVQKGATLMRAAHSGARASYIADIRRSYWESESWQSHVQRVLTHLSEDPGITEMFLVDKDSVAVAHSDPDKVGKKIHISGIPSSMEPTQPAKVFFGIIDNSTEGRFFQAVQAFQPFAQRNGHGFMRRNNSGGMLFMERQWKKMLFPKQLPKAQDSDEVYTLVVRLEMTEYDHTLGRLRVQIFILSLAMLLVGLAGWFSLSMVQGYRVSQKTLNEIQAFTSLLIKSLPVGIVATDANGNIANWNQSVERFTGISQSQTIGRKPKNVLPAQLAAFFSDVSGSAANSSFEKEVQLDFAGQKYVFLCRLVQIIDKNQTVIGKVLLLSDISQVKHLEEKMKESERLAAIGKMAGGVAHEVRNPLSSIKGLGLLLKNKFARGSKEWDTAELLIQETERMNRTITEMLSFTRPVSLHIQPFDLKPLLEKEIELLQPETEDKNIAVKLETAEQTLPVMGDPDRITQVVINLLLNSIQAMPDGGKLKLVACQVKGEKNGEQMVELKISDTGTGMDGAVLNQVFYPYFTTKKNGTGIGLALSQKIIADHGGHIGIESELHKGTVVTVQLPAA